MFCNNCKSARPENEAPCPNCGAPSSLLGQYQTGGWGTGGPVSTAWNASATSFNQQWNNQNPQFPSGAQSSFSAGQSWSQQANFQDQPMPQQPSWNAAMTAPAQGQQEQGAQSLLPVPYAGNAQEGDQQQQMQLVPFQQQMQLAIPDGQAETVYVPPMYTKPRPIIPRYRILSGILSVLIVALLVCAGSAYFAQSKGLFTTIGRLAGTVPPPNTIAPAAQKIPDPPVVSAVAGPAIIFIPAATTTMFIDQKSFTPREQDKILQVGVPFYVTFSVKPPKVGNVLVKWYMNGQYYTSTLNAKPIDPKQDIIQNGFVKITYAIPSTGIAEVYWVGQGQAPQLGLKLYFSVR